MTRSAPKRVMFYVQHLLGIGHLARASLICDGLVDKGFEVTMVMGGMPVAGFPGKRVEVIYLPVLKAGCFQFNDLTDANGILVDEEYRNNRRDQLLAIFERVRPDILIIEAFPFGRRQMKFELIPLLEAAKSASWKPLVAGSVRDIVQEKKKLKRLKETVATVISYYDLLLVHGDPEFCALHETFELADQFEHLIKYTGIVSADIPPLTGPQYDVVVSAGGGAAGELIMSNALNARPLTCLSNANWCFLTGPNLSKKMQETLRHQANKKLTIETHRTDFRAMLAHARLSISQAGYNTTADILRAKCPNVLVPFSLGGETEQTRRVARLSERGLALSIAEENINPKALAHVIDQAFERSWRVFDDIKFDLKGASQSAEILLSALQLKKLKA